MAYKPILPYHAGLFACSKTVVREQLIIEASLKQASDERALVQTLRVHQTLERYESTTRQPQCAQWSRTARQLLAVPLALLNTGTVDVPMLSPVADDSMPSPINTPTHQRVPRP